jgi:hypothetical protein
LSRGCREGQRSAADSGRVEVTSVTHAFLAPMWVGVEHGCP